MKLKNFNDYLKKRLNSEEIKEIENQAEMEFEFLKALQEDVAQIVGDYMLKNKIGFNELVRRLNTTPAQVSKVQKGSANLTLSSLAHIAALFNKKPHIVFEDFQKT
ncbi:MAG: hypothetical protein B7Y25_02680 [Alphaproteobacteria bacterium 16-39-46]|nr:MAG: hypothetical protein B7Y25_02680 [Alphaproteobacteria bacterium 16-39-46]OZA43545.1 MAG: hypothetical protein B7X84_02850 [Alphaproteobacteria bacterium 17-39-52]HQS83802.1 hypothetical protein [Alphaproteobacteria bacterium]HQS93585.1 hypothetical protein [Alphaproteobacteria bacterium]